MIDVALGRKPDLTAKEHHQAAGIRFIFDQGDADYYRATEMAHRQLIVESQVEDITDRNVVDSSTRFGYFIVAGDDPLLIRNIVGKEG